MRKRLGLKTGELGDLYALASFAGMVLGIVMSLIWWLVR